MEKIKGNDNEQLIKAAKEQLRWYTLEASEEEFDADKVDALVNLLNTLEPVVEEEQSEEEVLERFHAYIQQREAEEGISSFNDVSEISKRNGTIKVIKFVKAHKLIATAAAILIIIMVAGGSMGMVNAGKGNGFFYWLQRDKESMTVITSPENMGEKIKVGSAVEYFQLEDIPEEYAQYIVDVQDIEQLQEYDMKSIWMTNVDGYYGIKRVFEDNTEEHKIYIGVFIYPNDITLHKEVLLGKGGEGDISDWGDTEIIARKNPDGESEYTLFFFVNNVEYYVEGNVDKGVLEEIAEKYKEAMWER